jgi:hypothetical protein
MAVRRNTRGEKTNKTKKRMKIRPKKRNGPGPGGGGKAGKKPTKKRAARKKKTTKKRIARKKTVKRKTVEKAKPRSKPKPKFTCVLCGVEVGVAKEGLGISRLMCCGHPMRRK